MPLLICRTCPRYDAVVSGRFGRELDAAIGDNPGAAGLRIRHVQCLGGCPEDGVVAVDGMGKARVRFTGLTADDADAVVDAAHAHHASPTGAPDDWDVPAQLSDRISTVTFKRTPRVTNG